MHDVSGLDWYAIIILSTMAFRFILMGLAHITSRKVHIHILAQIFIYLNHGTITAHKNLIAVHLLHIYFLKVANKRRILYNNMEKDVIPSLRKKMAIVAKKQNLSDAQIRRRWNG